MSDKLPDSPNNLPAAQPTSWEEVKQVYETWHPGLRPYIEHHLADQGLFPPAPLAGVPADPADRQADPNMAAAPLSESEKIKHRLETYFGSNDFKAQAELAGGHDFERKSDFIGDLIQYGILFPDDDLGRLSSFATALSASYSAKQRRDENHNSSLITTRIAEKIGIAPDSIESRQEDIARYAYDRYVTNGYVFHGFNSHVEQSILRHGLSGEKREWDNDDIRAIDELFTRHGKPRITGWHTSNSEGVYFVSEDPKAVYSYAARSPEWFSSFVGGSINYSHIRRGDGHTFSRRDHEEAQYNLTTLMSELGFSDKDEQLTRSFFDKHWGNLAEGTVPKMAIVKRVAVDGRYRTDFDRVFTMFSKLYGGRETTSADRVNSILNGLYRNSDRSEKATVPPDEITVVSLPL